MGAALVWWVWLQEVVFDKRVQQLVNSLVSSGVKDLVPLYDTAYGYRYPFVEELLGLGPIETANFLEELAEKGVLRKSLYLRYVICSRCKSPDVAPLYKCQHCGSLELRRRILTESKEGKISEVGEEEEPFIAQKGLRVVGMWFLCDNCKKTSDEPNYAFLCRECGEEFTLRKALLRDAYRYTLNEEFVDVLRESLMLYAPIRELLEEKGFIVEAPGTLTGSSGVSHRFDFIAYRYEGSDRKVYAVDVAMRDSPVEESDVISLFVKVFDAKPTKAILVVVPGATEKALKLAQSYGIDVVYGKDVQEAIERLGKALS